MFFLKDKEFLKKVVALSIPIALQNLVTSILNIFDQMMVGWLPSDIADRSLSAVLLANQIVYIFQIVLYAAGNTMNIFVSQYTDSGREKDIPRRIGFLLVFDLALTFIVTLLCCLAPQVAIGVFNPSPEYKELAEDFLRVVSLSFIPMSVSICFSFSMRAIKRMKVALTANITAVLLNIMFNYWFMFGGLGVHAMGLIGAAYGTVISRTIEMLIIIAGLAIFRYPLVASPKKMFRFGDGFFRSFIRMFIPVLCNELFWVISATLYLTVYDKLPDSSTVLAAVNIARCVDNFVSVAMIGVGSAAGIVIGNLIGAGEMEKVHDYAKKSMQFALTLGVIIGLMTAASAFFAPKLFRNVSIAAQHKARNLLFLYGITAIFRTMTFMLVIGILRSGGDTTFCMVGETLAIWLVSMPLVLIGGLVFKWNIYVLYLLGSVCELIKTVIFTARVKGNKWIKLKVGKAENNCASGEA